MKDLVQIDLKNDQMKNLVQIDMKDDRKTFLSRRNVSSLFDSANEVIDLQTNDILMLADLKFADAKKKAIVEAKIMTKLRKMLDSKISIKFNDTIIARFKNEIYLNQIIQFDHLQQIKKINADTINSRNVIRFDLTSTKQYVTQRTRDAYLTSICQLEAFYDLSIVAQSIDYSLNDIETLNKRII
jgi:hypothetical protein